MASQEYLYKMLLRQNYRNLWLTDLMSTIQADFSLGHAFPTCSAEGLFTMTCQCNFSGPSVARVIYHAVGNVEKVDAQSSSFALSCLDLFHCCNDHRKTGDPKKFPRYYPVCLTLYTGQSVHACMQVGVLQDARLNSMVADTALD